MRIAYLTTDEVNRHLAARAAGDCGASLDGPPPDGPPPDGGFDAVLYDLDHLPPPRGRAVVDELLAAPPRIPAAVHGYGLEDGRASALRVRGVIVARRLEPGLIRVLCRAAGSAAGGGAA